LHVTWLTVSAYWPAAQFRQLAPDPGKYLPVEQLVQTLDPATANLPLVQAPQLTTPVAPSEYWPAGQSAQLPRPVVGANFPLGHTVQVPLPPQVSLKWPAGQPVQLAEPNWLNLPEEQHVQCA